MNKVFGVRWSVFGSVRTPNTQHLTAVQLILSHINTDFDSLGAMVGAGKLYPQARMVLTGGQDRNVRDFLTLHDEFLDLMPAREVDPTVVTRVIVVETQSSRRLGEMADLVHDPRVEVILYDHHVGAECDIPARERHIAPVGAATTLLVRELRARASGIDGTASTGSESNGAASAQPAPLTPLEATTMLLGIYEDTGSLTFSATTPEDLEAAAWLLRAGANLDVVSRFVNRALTPEQRRLLNELLRDTEYLEINGVGVAIARSEAGPFVNELALLAHKLSELENVPLVFVLARMGEAIYVVGRARSDAAHVGEVLAALGGGGHSRAASAVCRGGDVATVRTRLLAALSGRVRREPVAREIMSVPARTVSPDATIAEARRQMLRYGHSGLSVVDDGRLVGVITRRDVDKARHHRLAHAPVKGFMTRQVVTATPGMPLSDMERRMIERDVGRLPVVEAGHIVGVVTRRDLLRARCGGDYAGAGVPVDPDDIARRLEERLPRRVQEVLHEVGEMARHSVAEASHPVAPRRLEVYLVGGFVRDLLLDVQNLDVDLVVEGDATRFAAEVARRMGGKLKGHHRFATATVTLPDGVKLDFSTARSESYGQPGALPDVEASSIEDDLKRRDFTINAMAIRINPERFGELLDPFQGRADLERGFVRVLHNLSFVEDPTRIFRAVRFEARYGFHMDEHTEGLARHALAAGALEQISPERRRAEFNLLLREPNPVGGLRRITELGILDWLSPGLQLCTERLERVEGALAWTARHAGGAPASRKVEGAAGRSLVALDRTVVYLAVLLADLGPRRAATVAEEKLRLSEPKRELLALCLERLPRTVEVLSHETPRPHEIYRALQGLPPEVLALARIWRRDLALDGQLELFLSRLRDERLEITGDDLRALGIPPGPEMGEALRRTLNARLDGEVAGREAELACALRMLGRAPAGETP
jgi:tRNA nucleotidyltransferase (CCA-adding enzyme)